VAEWLETLDISEASQQSTAAMTLTAVSADTTDGRGNIQSGDMPTD
jgi:hypothetical protein